MLNYPEERCLFVFLKKKFCKVSWKSWYFPKSSIGSIPVAYANTMNALIKDKAIKIIPDITNYALNNNAFMGAQASKKDISWESLETILPQNQNF